MGGKKNNKTQKKGKAEKNVTVVHAYEDRPAHLSDPLKYPDPNEQVAESKAPRLDLRKKLFLCGNIGCKHDVRDHGAVPNPSIGNTAGGCKIPSCKCRKYKFTGKVDFGEVEGKRKVKAKTKTKGKKKK